MVYFCIFTATSGRSSIPHDFTGTRSEWLQKAVGRTHYSGWMSTQTSGIALYFSGIFHMSWTNFEMSGNFTFRTGPLSVTGRKCDHSLPAARHADRQSKCYCESQTNRSNCSPQSGRRQDTIHVVSTCFLWSSVWSSVEFVFSGSDGQMWSRLQASNKERCTPRVGHRNLLACWCVSVQFTRYSCIEFGCTGKRWRLCIDVCEYFSSGGVELLAQKGKIKVQNTLESRLDMISQQVCIWFDHHNSLTTQNHERCSKKTTDTEISRVRKWTFHSCFQMLPELREMLFGANPNRKFKDWSCWFVENCFHVRIPRDIPCLTPVENT